MELHASPKDTVQTIWRQLRLPEEALSALHLGALQRGYVKSSYKITRPVRRVEVDPLHAVIEFNSEKYTWLNGQPPESLWGPLSGLYECGDGHVRLHDGFINHRQKIMAIFNCDGSKANLARVLKEWKKGDVEELAYRSGFAAYALRTEQEWSMLPQSKSRSGPIKIVPLTPSTPSSNTPSSRLTTQNKPLSGIKVIEFSRVLAAPIAGRTLAWHGADVIWVSSPNLPSLPSSDRDVMRGKRHVELDLELEADREKLRDLVKDADVFLQSYRPGSLARRGFGPEELRKINPRLIYARYVHNDILPRRYDAEFLRKLSDADNSLSAWNDDGPWADRRGFDSLVQTATGLNTSEALAAGKGEAGRPLPCQALDHSAGYFLAAGIVAALRQRHLDGIASDVSVSLRGCMELLKDLGRAEHGFEEQEYTMEDVLRSTHDHQTDSGVLRGVTHAAEIEGRESGFEHFPKESKLDDPVWL